MADFHCDACPFGGRCELCKSKRRAARARHAARRRAFTHQTPKPITPENTETQMTEATRPRSDYHTITLTNAPPVRILKADWPVIASSKAHQGEHEFQSHRKWRLTVRRHADGRAIVYGVYDTHYASEDSLRAGELLEASDDDAALVGAIRTVGETIGASPVTVQDCIADLPARDLA